MTTKKMTPAFKKIDDYRISVNLDRSKIIAEDLSSCCFLYTTSKGYPAFIGYKGRSKKASVHRSYVDIQQRDLELKAFMNEQSLMKERLARKPRKLKLEDVVYASWGCEQTNINFYKVIKLVGENSVQLVEIAQEKTFTCSMTGTCIPVISEVIGEPFNRRCDGDLVKIDSVKTGSLLQPIDPEKGRNRFKPLEWSSYA